MASASASRSLLRAVGLAAITGSRTTLGPAMLCRSAVGRRPLRAAIYMMAVAELVGDKLPRTPSRTAPLALALRIASGAGVAFALLRGRGRAIRAAALAVGAAGAVCGAFAGLRARLALTRLLGGGTRANALAGAIEDAALVAAGRRLAAALK
jgi:uncharacterized membrane protein